MINNSWLEIEEGAGLRGGLTIQIAQGHQSTQGQAPSIYLTDEAFSFVEPSLFRHAAQYGNMSRWGVTEVSRSEWQLIVDELKHLSAQFSNGQKPLPADFIWVHTADLDSDVETDSVAFSHRFDDPPTLRKLSEFLVGVADWVERTAQSEKVLTVFGV
jgi:hypothetical protein